MFTDDSPQLAKIEDRLRDAIRLGLEPNDDNIEDVLLAHMHMLVWYLSIVCPKCRCRIWKGMKRLFPDTIRYAIDLHTSRFGPSSGGSSCSQH
jgi:hypothetical protein